MIDKLDERFLEKLQCLVEGLTYDFVARRGHLDMPRGSCCDCDGCLDLFQRIDPEVERIDTYAGGRKDAAYIREAPNRWHVNVYVYDGRGHDR